MKFETKTFIYFLAILIIGLSIINSISIFYFKLNFEQELSNEAKLVGELVNLNPNTELPFYFKYSEKFELDPDYEIILKTNSGYIYVNKIYKYSKIKSYALILFLWESALVLLLIYLFYITVLRYLKKEEETKKFLELFILALTHKLGNFLSIQKLNLELIKTKCGNLKALERLEKSYQFMEKDFNLSLKVLKNIKNIDNQKKLINLKDIIENILKQFETELEEKDLKLRLKDAYVRINETDAENIFFNLIENSIKYSENKIYIRIFKTKKNICVAVKNDIGASEKGSGVGELIINYLVGKYGGKYIKKVKKEYLGLVLFKK